MYQIVYLPPKYPWSQPRPFVVPAGQASNPALPGPGGIIWMLVVFGAIGTAIYMSRPETPEEKARYDAQAFARQAH